MKTRIEHGKKDFIIPERVPVCHESQTSAVYVSLAVGKPVSDAADVVPPRTFARPPRIAGVMTCRGCFNRCTLAQGEPGVCMVKRNIGGRITSFSLRVKAIVSCP